VTQSCFVWAQCCVAVNMQQTPANLTIMNQCFVIANIPKIKQAPGYEP